MAHFRLSIAGNYLASTPSPCQSAHSKLNRTENNIETKMAKKPLGPTGEFFRRRDEWRKHPMLSNQLRHATPGLGIALVAFGIYLIGETAYNKIYAAPSHSHSSSASNSSH